MTNWGKVRVFGARPTAVSAIVRPSAYGIVTNRQGHLAVVRTPIGLSLPGGGSDEPEAPEATVLREAREECGLDVRVGPWRRTAIEHVFSTAEQAQFEKRNTFCDATVIGAVGEPSEPDHLFGVDAGPRGGKAIGAGKSPMGGQRMACDFRPRRRRLIYSPAV